MTKPKSEYKFDRNIASEFFHYQSIQTYTVVVTNKKI